MENSAKALYIAGSLLIALLVISLLVYTFNNLGKVQEQKDEIEYEESITAFNKEYEAFDKKIMYGVDVISCINKAVSNNEKYVKDGRWASGGASGEEALVQVEVILKERLKESFQIYYVNDKDKEVTLYNITAEDVINSFPEESIEEFFKLKTNYNILTSLDMRGKNISTFFKSETGGYVTNPQFSLGIDKVKASEVTSDELEGTGTYYVMRLLTNTTKKVKFEEGVASLRDLVAYSNNLEVVRNNDFSDTKIWSSVKWTTALSDFKKRKFKCIDINYNENTGRIESISFQEK